MLQTRSKRLETLPPYLFAEIDKKKMELIKKGVDVINLGIGDPDLAPPQKMITAMIDALGTKEFHQYPYYNGSNFFRHDVAKWLKEHHGVEADAESEVLTLIGSKEGLSHLSHAVLNPGDKVLITDPCYPVHLESALLAGAKPVRVPLRESNGFLPNLSEIAESDLRDAKLFVINYPNNPTSAVATKEFFKEIVTLAHKYEFIICQDAAYIDVCLEGEKQPSIMSIPGAKDVAIEFFSASKMFNICGWRIGFCVGNKNIVSSLGKFKMTVDSGQFTVLQKAVSVGLKECMGDMKRTLGVYNERKKILCAGLEEMGLGHFQSNSTFYIWSNVPQKYSSKEYSAVLLEKTGIVATPGLGFGSMGDKYIRFSLTSPNERIVEATRRMKEIS